MPIICGANQYNDIIQALLRIDGSMLMERRISCGDYHHDSVWLTWTSIIQNLENAVTPSISSISVKNSVLKEQKKAIERLHELRKRNQANHMQRGWGRESKLEYAQFLADIMPEDYLNGIQSKAAPSRGGGGAVFSREQQQQQQQDEGRAVDQAEAHVPSRPHALPSADIGGSEEGKVDGTDSKGTQYFREIGLQLSQLLLDSSKLDSNRAAVSDRVDEQMDRKEEKDRAAALEIERREAECALDVEVGGAAALQAARVAMRQFKLSEEEEDAVSRALARPHNDTILIDKFNQDISRLKMSCLLPGEGIEVEFDWLIWF
jgi:hypothetical protein